jgi:hypothetical protein
MQARELTKPAAFAFFLFSSVFICVYLRSSAVPSESLAEPRRARDSFPPAGRAEESGNERVSASAGSAWLWERSFPYLSDTPPASPARQVTPRGPLPGTVRTPPLATEASSRPSDGDANHELAPGPRFRFDAARPSGLVFGLRSLMLVKNNVTLFPSPAPTRTSPATAAGP